MAAQVLRKGQAIVWVPPRAIGDRALASEAVLLALLPGAVAHARPASPPAAQSPAGTSGVVRYAKFSFDALPALRSVTLIFDARDTTLLRTAVPPLSGTRLQQALPNIVEDLLLQDAQHCGFALGPRDADGLRLIAAIDAQWLDQVVTAFERRGMRVAAAWPAQLALPRTGPGAALGCVNDGLALRTGPLEGLGWNAAGEPGQRAQAIVSLLQAAWPEGLPTADDAAVNTGERTLVAYVEDDDWRPALAVAATQLGISIGVEPLPVPVAAPVDLLAARRGTAAGRWLADVDWRAWRLPGALALATIVLALLGLNLQWARLAQERDDLRTAIEQRFRQTFPGTRVIVDPVLQMERQVAALRTGAGQSGPEDFVPLLARFSQVLGAQAVDALAGIEFRDSTLRVRFQPGAFESRAVREALVQASQRLGLQLRFDAEGEPTASVGLLR